MTRCFPFFITTLLLLSYAEARPISITTTITVPESNPHGPASLPMTPSTEEASIEDEGCRDLESEWCLMRRSMIDHSDYIYTENTSEP
ncbi:hypothetical protein CsSME_00022078 [Camellia sinensis var. sinensis]|uniref:Phytosulfokines 3 n=1 Tax=Camellia lanceoleosa TaxID=1840588 RepID=A0ACC0IBU6_9ERIC|nr:Phytosulfokines 3 [Camellia lanceoleosa]